MKQIKDFFEIIYYITAGPLLLTVGIIGLNQLWLAKKNLKITKETLDETAKREAALLSIQLINNTNEKLSKYSMDLSSALGNQKIPSYNKIVTNFKIDFEALDKDIRAKWIEIYNNNILNMKCSDLANELENLALPVRYNHADENLLFNSISAVFISYTTLCFPFIHLCREKYGPITYENIIWLYDRWKVRLPKENLERRLKQII